MSLEPPPSVARRIPGAAHKSEVSVLEYLGAQLGRQRLHSQRLTWNQGQGRQWGTWKCVMVGHTGENYPSNL